MDRATVAVYERHARDWLASRRAKAIEDGRLAAFARRARRGGMIADLGCGPGWYAARMAQLGFRVVGVDAAAAMLAAAARHAPGVPRVQADLAALPFAARTLDGAWATNCYQHLASADLPFALAQLHLSLRPGAAVDMTLTHLGALNPTDSEQRRGESDRHLDRDELVGRLFSAQTAARARALCVGAGFEHIRIRVIGNGFWLHVRARRARSLPDWVGPDLRLLVCGLNPSLYAADIGVPFGRPGNRFWPAALAAGLVARNRDPLDAFRHQIGMTDLVKRATAASASLGRAEYTAGLRRVEALVRLYRPRTLCFVGLEGWRHAMDRTAQPGWIASGFGGQPAYLMPSTSGRNARVSLAVLAAHLRAAVTLSPERKAQ